MHTQHDTHDTHADRKMHVFSSAFRYTHTHTVHAGRRGILPHKDTDNQP